MKYLLFLLLWLPGLVCGQVITTVIGGGSGSGLGDGGPATLATFDYIFGTAIDSHGNIFVADFLNFRVRKFNRLTGIVETVAGTGVAGSSGNGGPATLAQLGYVAYIAIDSFDNLYLAERDSNRIRKVNSVGIIDAYAGTGTVGATGDGGPASSATLYQPGGLAIDTHGNLYISDVGNATIRKIDKITGYISTVAGNGSTGFGGDGGPATNASFGCNDIYVDVYGSLYIADRDNSRVRKVDAFSGVINTIVGNGAPVFNGDGLAATTTHIDPWAITMDVLGNLYISDFGNNRVRKLSKSSGLVSTIAGNGTYGFSGDGAMATLANLKSPSHLIFDTSGNIYIADTYNARVRKVALGIHANALSDITPKKVEIFLFPNPTHNKTVIKAEEIITAVSITNLIGQVVYTSTAINEREFVVPVEGFAAGVYFVKVGFGDGSVVVDRFVKE